MKAFRLAIASSLAILLAGCAVVPCGYGCQSGYYSRPIYYTQTYYARPFVVAGWHHEHHHGYY